MAGAAGFAGAFGFAADLGLGVAGVLGAAVWAWLKPRMRASASRAVVRCFMGWRKKPEPGRTSFRELIGKGIGGGWRGR
jgi:hypothetical protein